MISLGASCLARTIKQVMSISFQKHAAQKCSKWSTAWRTQIYHKWARAQTSSAGITPGRATTMRCTCFFDPSFGLYDSNNNNNNNDDGPFNSKKGTTRSCNSSSNCRPEQEQYQLQAVGLVTPKKSSRIWVRARG